MPIYEFICPECKERLEAIISYEKSLNVTCPECGARLEKLISKVNFKCPPWDLPKENIDVTPT